jgi:hypothetical protein
MTDLTPEEREAAQRANRALNRWMAQFFPKLAPEQKATDRHRRSYLYWRSPDQRMFCYTPWKDANGDYWTWVMKPVGRGARSGKARRWRRVGKRVRSRSRKTASKRARKRYDDWLRYLHNRSLPLDERI